MKLFYSKTTGGFYDDRIHTTIPDDAVEITEDLHASLLDGERAGRRITSDADGKPMLADPLPLSADALWALLRRQRDALLKASDKTQIPDYPLSADAKAAWATYRQALRDLPSHTEDPASPVWPSPPA